MEGVVINGGRGYQWKAWLSMKALSMEGAGGSDVQDWAVGCVGGAYTH